MSVKHVLSPVQFHTRVLNHGDGHASIDRFHGDEHMGHMTLEPHPDGSRIIEGLEVHPAYQREGHATEMFHVAEKLGMRPTHSTDRTYEGDQWAKKVGGHLPKIDGYADHYGEWNQ